MLVPVVSSPDRRGTADQDDRLGRSWRHGRAVIPVATRSRTARQGRPHRSFTPCCTYFPIDQTANDQHLIDGLDDLKTKLASLLLVGAVVPTNDLVATLQSRIDARKTTESTRATWQTTVKAERDLEDKTKTVRLRLEAESPRGPAGDIDTLAKFGLTPRQKPVAAPDVKVAAAAKAAARHTMGPKQKANVKGTVTPTAPATAVPTAPAPNPTTQPVPPAASPIAVAPSPVTPAPAQAAPPVVTTAPRIP